MKKVESKSRSPELAEWCAGWSVVLAALVGLAVSNLPTYSAGVLIGPMEAELGWSRSFITSGLLIQSLATFALSPIIGRLIDRFGARRLAIPGFAAICVGFAAISMTGSSTIGYLCCWLIIALGGASLSMATWAAVVASRFERQRGLALAVALCGAGLGSSLIPLAAHWLTSILGWRGAFFSLGSSALLVVPLLIWAFRDKQDIEPASKRSREASIPFSLLFRSRHFYALAFAGFFLATTVITLLVHLVALLTASGLDRGTAAAIMGLIGISTVVGRLLTGAVLDRSSGPLIGGISFSLPILTAILLLVGSGDVWIVGAAVTIFGLALGAEGDILAYMTARYFGVAGYGGVFSLYVSLMALGTGFGPWLASLWVDAGGAYSALLIVMIPFSATAALLVATLGPWRLVVPRYNGQR